MIATPYQDAYAALLAAKETPQPVAADAVHFLAINSDWDEPRLKLVCTATKGADCHKTHPDPNVEMFYPDDPDLIDTDTCWAVEWAEDGGWETVAVKEGAEFPMIPVHITNDEGPVIEPVLPHQLLPIVDAPQPVSLPSEEQVAAAWNAHYVRLDGSIQDGDECLICDCGSEFSASSKGQREADEHKARAVLALFAGADQ